MAVFERQKKSAGDQTDPVRAEIQGTENFNGYTEYIVNVTKGYGASVEQWQVRRRYSDFQNLYQRLKMTHFTAKLPPKKLIGNFNRDFISQRLSGLQAYLTEVLSQPLLATSLVVLTFLHPDKISLDKSDEAKQLVSFYMRSTHKWETTESLSMIGWRLDKFHFGVRCLEDKTSQLLLTWCFYGPDLTLGANDLIDILNRMRQIKHPFLSQIQGSWCGDQGGLVVRQRYSDGSLRDVLRKAVLNQFYLEKYGWGQPTNRVEQHDLKLFGYQILSGLYFLHHNGIPFTNLHCGNLFAVGDTIEISDVEDDLFGLASCYRPLFVQCKAVKTVEDVAVYCFGMTFYEMATGKQLKTPCIVSVPDCKDSVVGFLNRILSSHATKTQLPKLWELLSDRFFDGPHRSTTDEGGVIFSDYHRQSLDRCRHAIESRLARDQMAFRRAENDKKFRRFISSDEGQVHMRSLSSQASLKNDANGDQPDLDQLSLTRSEDSPNGEVSLMSKGAAGFVSHSHVSAAPTNSGFGATETSPPPPPPPPLPVMKLSSSSSASSSSLATGGSVDGGEQRNALLDSVRNFNRSRLKAVDEHH